MRIYGNHIWHKILSYIMSIPLQRSLKMTLQTCGRMFEKRKLFSFFEIFHSIRYANAKTSLWHYTASITLCNVAFVNSERWLAKKYSTVFTEIKCCLYKKNRKHLSVWIHLISTLVEIGKVEIFVFSILTNFHSCWYNCIPTHKNIHSNIKKHH